MRYFLSVIFTNFKNMPFRCNIANYHGRPQNFSRSAKTYLIYIVFSKSQKHTIFLAGQETDAHAFNLALVIRMEPWLKLTFGVLKIISVNLWKSNQAALILFGINIVSIGGPRDVRLSNVRLGSGNCW